MGSLEIPRKGKGARRRRAVAVNGTGNADDGAAAPVAVDWKHDPTKYGMPTQEWSAPEKMMWTLYVVSEATDRKELPSSQVAATFNKHFRQAGLIPRANVSRDLGLKKTKQLVGEDTTKDPSTWYLTDSGRSVVQQLIAKSKG
jgi:hypothetical protein